MWKTTEHGATIGTIGSENGIIVRDEEHQKGARLSIEEGGNIAPFSIVSGVYGSFVHTTFLSSLEVAESKFEVMKKEVDIFLSGNFTDKEKYEWIDQFVKNH